MDECLLIDDPYAFDYMMLSRLKQDCDFYIGQGKQSAKYLYYTYPEIQIKEMKRLWKGFPEDRKPIWCTFENILEYEKQMLGGKLI